MTIQEKLDQKLFGDLTIRTFLQDIYNKACNDRVEAKDLINKMFNRYDESNKDKDDNKKINPEEDLHFPISTYMKLMKQSNDQLLEIAKIAEKMINGKITMGIRNSGENNNNEDENEFDVDNKLVAIMNS